MTSFERTLFYFEQISKDIKEYSRWSPELDAITDMSYSIINEIREKKNNEMREEIENFINNKGANT